MRSMRYRPALSVMDEPIKESRGLVSAGAPYEIRVSQVLKT